MEAQGGDSLLMVQKEWPLKSSHKMASLRGRCNGSALTSPFQITAFIPRLRCLEVHSIATSDLATSRNLSSASRMETVWEPQRESGNFKLRLPRQSVNLTACSIRH